MAAGLLKSPEPQYSVVWMVSYRVLISNFSCPCTNPLVTVPCTPITIDITITFMFHSFLVTLLLYRCTTFTPSKGVEKKLDENYTRMLRAVLDKSWKQHPTKQLLYGHSPPISQTHRVRRRRHVGHCCLRKDELISNVIFCNLKYGHDSV